MLTTNNNEVFRIKLNKKGLNLFPLESQLLDKDKFYFVALDGSTDIGQIEYFSISSQYDWDIGIIYYKNTSRKFILQDKDSVQIDLYLGINDKNKIKTITIKIYEDSIKIKEMLDRIYGVPDAEMTSGIEEFSNTFSWSTTEFDLTYSSDMNTIRISIPPPQEYWMELIQKYPPIL